MMRMAALVGAIAFLRFLIAPALIALLLTLGTLSALPESDFAELRGLAAWIHSWAPAFNLQADELREFAKFIEVFALMSVAVGFVMALFPLFLSWNRARLLRLRRLGIGKNKRVFMHLATLDWFNWASFKNEYFQKVNQSGIKRADFLFMALGGVVSLIVIAWAVTLILGSGPLGRYGELIVFSAVSLAIIFEQYRPRAV